MSGWRGDYLGFTYGSKPDGTPMHSSDLGIVRTSEGSRFNENLLPTMQDKTVQVPGGDGTYYFGSYFTQRQFSVSFAFDSLTEEQIKKIRAHFGDKKIHDLIFDERPFLIWHAKVTGTATIKYIPFAEGETNRLYKGEGTIQFTCYQPYAICEKKWLDQYSDCKNIDEWKIASRLKEHQDVYDSFTSQGIQLYNAGDIEAHFQLRIDFVDSKIPTSKMYIDENSSYQLVWKEILAKEQDAYIKFNTKLNLLEGYDMHGVKTGNVYNDYLTEGDFFKIPLGESSLKFDESNGELSVKSIEYNYYYI